MIKTGQREILMQWIEYNQPNEVASFNIICKATPYGWLGTSADRVARECVARGTLKRQHYIVKGFRYSFYSVPSPEKEQGN